jgi:hypothetical protein
MIADLREGIGLDYDGTIADTGAAKATWISEHLGLTIAPWKTDRTLCVPLIGDENYERMGRAVYAPEASMRADEVPGVLQAVRAFASCYRLYIVTARGLAGIAWSQKWLQAHGLAPYITGYLSSGERAADGGRVSKARLCLQNDIRILIDDDERHLLDPDMAAFRRILLKAGCDEPYSPAPGIELATSWLQVQELLNCEGTIGSGTVHRD